MGLGWFCGGWWLKSRLDKLRYQYTSVTIWIVVVRRHNYTPMAIWRLRYEYLIWQSCLGYSGLFQFLIIWGRVKAACLVVRDAGADLEARAISGIFWDADYPSLLVCDGLDVVQL